MKILFLIPTLAGAGAERQLAYLSEQLVLRGHEVVVSFIERGLGAWPEGVPVHQLPRRAPWNPLLILDVVRLIRRWSPDVIQTCLPHMDVVGGLAALITRVPFIIREPNEAKSYRGVRAVLRKIVGRGASGVIAVSVNGASYWPGRASVIPNGVPFERIASTSAAPRPSHAIVGIYSGRLVAEKRVDVLLRASAVLMKDLDLFLIICGTGSELDSLVNLAHELGIADRVQFHGFVLDVWAYQRTADFAALLSEFEGQPNVVGECFAAGTPMILSDIAPHRELAGTGEALLVPAGNVEATVAAIRMLIDDSVATAERAQRARLRAEQWRVEDMAARYESAFENLRRW